MTRAVGAPVVMLDARGIIRDADSEVGALVGVEPEALLGQDFVEHLADSRSGAELREWLRTMPDRPIGARPALFAGSRPGVVWQLRPTRDEGSAPTGAVAVAILDDIARTYLEATDDCVFAKDPEHRILFVNAAYARSVGRDPEDLVGLLDTEIWPVDEVLSRSGRGAGRFRADDLAALSGKTIHTGALSLKQPDGTFRVFDNTKVPLRNALGEIYGVLGFSHDETARYAAARELETREERYRLLVEQAPVPLYVHDFTRIVFANRAFAKMLQRTVEDVVGSELESIVHPESWALVRRRIEQLRTEGSGGFNAPVFGQMLRADGQTVFVEVVAAPVTYEGAPGVQVVLMDVTERERALATVRERDAELRRVAEKLSEAQQIARLGYWEYDLDTTDLV